MTAEKCIINKGKLVTVVETVRDFSEFTKKSEECGMIMAESPLILSIDYALRIAVESLTGKDFSADLQFYQDIICTGTIEDAINRMISA